jgi:hypothetical protein
VPLSLVALAGLTIAACSSSPSSSAKKKSHPPVTAPSLSADRCPLTDLPAPATGVPNRPALGVKIGNEPLGARPQSGLNEADVVFDTPAEGFIMRYIAVYQCNPATSIGPTRSLRFVDWHLMREFIHPILAFAGGINPDVNEAQSLGWLTAANLLEGAQAAGTRISSRSAPDNLYTSTSALYSLYPKDVGAPKPIFSYSSKIPATASPASTLSIDFSSGTDVVWKWDPSTSLWLHTYSGSQDVDAATSEPVSAANIIVEVVHYSIGPYLESPGGSGDIESQTVGSGAGWVLRNGKAIKVTWHRTNLIDPTTFTDSNNSNVSLTPGRTWVEIVTNSQAGSIKVAS